LGGVSASVRVANAVAVAVASNISPTSHTHLQSKPFCSAALRHEACGMWHEACGIAATTSRDATIKIIIIIMLYEKGASER